MGALVEEMTGIRRHDLFLAETTIGTGYYGIKLNVICHLSSHIFNRYAVTLGKWWYGIISQLLFFNFFILVF